MADGDVEYIGNFVGHYLMYCCLAVLLAIALGCADLQFTYHRA